MGFFLDCAFRMLIGWAGKVWSRGKDSVMRDFISKTSILHIFELRFQQQSLREVIDFLPPKVF